MTWILISLIVKHFLCDFPLQPPFMFLNKGKYGHPGGILHAFTHTVGTLAVCLEFGLLPWLAVADGLVHYHVDWAKNQINARFGLDPSCKYFWWLLGADQLAHYLTYAAIIGFAA